MHGIDQFLPGESRRPGLVFTPAGAHLRDDYQVIRIGGPA